MNRIKSILVGVDFDDGSLAALRYAVAIGQPNGAAVKALHVIDDLVLRDMAEASGQDLTALTQEVIAGTLAGLDRWVKAAIPEPAPAVDVAVGSAVEEIIGRVRADNHDLLAIGAGVAPNALGALAAKCVRKAPAKALVVRAESVAPPRRIVAGVDFSPVSTQVIEQGLRLKSLWDAEVHFVHVFVPPWRHIHYLAPTRQATPEYEARYKRVLSQRLEQAVRAGGGDPEATGVRLVLIENDSAWDGIVRYLTETQADLLVMGTRGRANLRYLLMGSTAEHVLCHTPCSVLAIKPTPTEAPPPRGDASDLPAGETRAPAR